MLRGLDRKGSAVQCHLSLSIGNITKLDSTMTMIDIRQIAEMSLTMSLILFHPSIINAFRAACSSFMAVAHTSLVALLISLRYLIPHTPSPRSDLPHLDEDGERAYVLAPSPPSPPLAILCLRGSLPLLTFSLE